MEDAVKDYEEYIKEDAEELSYHDKLTLVTIAGSGGKSKATRIQKLGLIINAIKEGKTPSSHEPYFYGGFSDNIEESLSYLLDSGLIKKIGTEYTITEYGKKVLKFLETNNDEVYHTLKDIVDKIMPSFRRLKDDELVLLTYILFPELTEKSLIKEDMEKSPLKNKIEKILKKGKLGDIDIYFLKSRE